MKARHRKIKLRKPLYGEAMVTYSTKLRRDQVESLRKISNAAELMRAWVERGLAEEHAEGAGSFMLARKITALEGEIVKLQNAGEYVKAKIIKDRGLKYYSQIAKLLDDENYYIKADYNYENLTINKGEQNEELLCRWPSIYCPGWTWSDLRRYLKDRGIYEWKPSIPRELQLEIVNKMIEAYPSEVQVFERYEAEITKLDTELQRLRQKASGQQ